MKKRGQYVSFAAGLPLADIFLSVYLLLFLVQIVYSLFDGDVVSTQANSIDVVMRTSAAMVFGYFISGAFENPTVRVLSAHILKVSEKLLRQILTRKKKRLESGFQTVRRVGYKKRRTQIPLKITWARATYCGYASLPSSGLRALRCSLPYATPTRQGKTPLRSRRFAICCRRV